MAMSTTNKEKQHISSDTQSTQQTAKQIDLMAEMVVQLRQFGTDVVLFKQKVAERVGLSLTDLQCMEMLDLMNTSTPGMLAESMAMTTGGVTVMLDRLEKAGHVKREPNPDDRRSVLVKPVPKKMEKIAHQHYAGVKAQFEAMLLETPENELEVVLRFFKRLNEIHPVRIMR